jgi:hypothetical protein
MANDVDTLATARDWRPTWTWPAERASEAVVASPRPGS